AAGRLPAPHRRRRKGGRRPARLRPGRGRMTASGLRAATPGGSAFRLRLHQAAISVLPPSLTRPAHWRRDAAPPASDNPAGPAMIATAPSVAEDGQVEPGEVPGVGDQVDSGDLPLRDREAERDPRPSAGR